MATAELVPHQITLGPGDVVKTGTAHATNITSFVLEDSTADPGLDLIVEPWDLVIDTTNGQSAHLMKALATNQLMLDKDIFTDGGEGYKIVRPANYRLIFPGSTFAFESVFSYSNRGTNYQGVELHSYNSQTRDRVFHAAMVDNLLQLQGFNIQAREIESYMLVNYIEHNVSVRVNGQNTTLPSGAFVQLQA